MIQAAKQSGVNNITWNASDKRWRVRYRDHKGTQRLIKPCGSFKILRDAKRAQLRWLKAHAAYLTNSDRYDFTGGYLPSIKIERSIRETKTGWDVVIAIKGKYVTINHFEIEPQARQAARDWYALWD